MPIRGIGIDIVKTDRIMASLERFGRRMEARLFTDAELEYCRGHRDPLPHLAARFAAKEAASKALGTGMSGGVGFRQIEVVQPGGRIPTLAFHGAALARYQALGCGASHLTLAHDGGLAVACVVLEGLMPEAAGQARAQAPARRELRRVLIANRGEIAVRVIRTLRERGVTSIALFSEPDREALHVLLADEAYPIGPGPARESYLDLERVIETAKRTRADAIHPGYGFHAENPAFARACEAAGITFVGPSAGTLEGLGDKLAARAAAARAEVPMVPASAGPLADLAAARAQAQALGLPLVLKAAAGGGGKGMRVIRRESELERGFELARGEARAAFGDDRLYAERYLERPRHVEAQILADRERVVFLGERECSIQRRHQKLFEETPSPALDARTRAALGEAACRIAREVGYLSAGTVEFLLDEDGRFYFLEVNTRLQVEHPVTEMVTGLDLVAEQLRVAAGEPLSFDEPPEPRGWAMEARLIAEDPRANFMPSVGRLERVRFPQGPGVRNDAGVYRGVEVPVFYDSLLAKLIVWGQDRDHARRRMERALAETVIEGLHHNLAFHRWLVRHPEFAAGRLSTRFLDEHFDPAQLALGREAAEVALVAAALHARAERASVTLPAGNGSRAPWRWAERRRGRPRAR